MYGSHVPSHCVPVICSFSGSFMYLNLLLASSANRSANVHLWSWVILMVSFNGVDTCHCAYKWCKLVCHSFACDNLSTLVGYCVSQLSQSRCSTFLLKTTKLSPALPFRLSPSYPQMFSGLLSLSAFHPLCLRTPALFVSMTSCVCFSGVCAGRHLCFLEARKW